MKGVFLAKSKSHIDMLLSDNVRFIFVPGPKVIKLFSCSTQLSMKF